MERELCPHDVATLLKEYFRDLPDSLLCKDLYSAFIQTQSKFCIQYNYLIRTVHDSIVINIVDYSDLPTIT